MYSFIVPSTEEHVSPFMIVYTTKKVGMSFTKTIASVSNGTSSIDDQNAEHHLHHQNEHHQNAEHHLHQLQVVLVTVFI